jgi:hypothetical protein
VTTAEGEQVAIGLDTAGVQDLLLALAQGLPRPDAPPSFRALVQWFAPRETRVELLGSAIPAIRQELEVGVSTTTTLDIDALRQLRDDCETVLAAAQHAAASPTTKKH